ncbi:LuxR C-terminal-related transcriptional regulator [Dictyobacter arantiisoli]|nr:LuxR C-terminal-related transcriptional regulator [Dictyobacter arantiisoli]
MIDMIDIYEAQEAERQRVAQALQNGVVQPLVSLVNDLESHLTVPMTALEQENEVHTWYVQAQTSLAQLRHILGSMDEQPQVEFDFIAAASKMFTWLKGAGYTVNLHYDKSTNQLPVEYNYNLYCIIRAAIINVCKRFAEAEVTVSLSTVDGHLLLGVQDTGTGVVPVSMSRTAMVFDMIFNWYQGLNDLYERIALLGGRLILERTPDQGTLIQVILPLPLSVMTPVDSAETRSTSKEDGLTMREREILTLTGQGCATKEIAHRLRISEKTVRNHISKIYNKLGVFNRPLLIHYAVKKGLVDLHAL